jgi:transposase-like protein
MGFLLSSLFNQIDSRHSLVESWWRGWRGGGGGGGGGPALGGGGGGTAVTDVVESKSPIKEMRRSKFNPVVNRQRKYQFFKAKLC